jgi:RNA polymerase sigma-70 factor (ECF subfamily)
MIRIQAMVDPGNAALGDELAVRAQAGCQESFEQLVDQYHQQIYHFLYQMTRNAHDAEDLTQETFIRACNHVGKYNPSYRFSTWLFTIARNCAMTHFRKQKRVEKTFVAEWEESQIEASVEPEDDGAGESLWAAARQLKPKQFEALWLRYHEGFSMQEIAGIMSSNVVSVKVNLHRARSALAAKLEKQKSLL